MRARERAFPPFRRVLKNSPDILISPRDCIPTSEPREEKETGRAKGEPADIRFHPFPSFLSFFFLLLHLLLLCFFFTSQFSSQNDGTLRTGFEDS